MLSRISRTSKNLSSPGKRGASGRDEMPPRASGATEEHGELPPVLDHTRCSKSTGVKFRWPSWETALTPHLSVIPEVLKGEISTLGNDSFLGLVSPACSSIGHSFITVKFTRCGEINSAEVILKIRSH